MATAAATAALATSERTSSAFNPSTRYTWRTGLTSIGIALAANLTVLGVALLVGAEMVAAQTSISGLFVAATTVVPLLAATLVLLPLRRWGARAWRVLATTGLAIGLVSSRASFTVSAENSTRAALAAMHLITGVTWFVIVRRAAARAGA
jgi:hypothetical protein